MMCKRKKRKEVGVFLPATVFVLWVFGSALGAPGERWFVSRNGRDTPDCGAGAGSQACASLGAVLARGSSLDHSTIIVEASSRAYACPAMSLRANITIQSSSSTQPAVFDCAGTKEWVSFLGAPHTTQIHLEGLAIEGCYSEQNSCIMITDTQQVTVTNSSFSNCTTAVGGGACIAIRYSSATNGANVTFSSLQLADAKSVASRNNASGGAVQVWFAENATNARIDVGGQTLCERVSSSSSGGCLSVTFNGNAVNSSVRVSGNATMINCTAQTAGGCLSVAYSMRSTTSRVEFRGRTSMRTCSAGQEGGCVSVSHRNAAEQATVTFANDTNLQSCTAVVQGGCISVSYSDISLDTAFFLGGLAAIEDCSSGNGGGCISVDHEGASARSDVAITGEILMNRCSAGSHGGCVHVYYGDSVSTSSFSIRGNVKFGNCSAGFNGGCVAIEHGDVVHDTSAVLDGAIAMSQCSAFGNGGCFALFFSYAAHNVSLRTKGTLVMDQCSALALGGCVVMWLQDTSENVTVAMEGHVSMRHCATGGNGGCMALVHQGAASASTIQFRNRTRLEHCSAGAGIGGCLSVTYYDSASSTSLDLRGTVAMGNCTAKQDGGCIAVRYDKDSVNASVLVQGKTVLCDCTAESGSGGCFATRFSGASINGSSLLLTNVEMRNAQASISGGAVAVFASSESAQGVQVTLANITVQNATATLPSSHGGGISVQCSDQQPLVMSGQTRSQWTYSCAAELTNVTVVAARAAYGGGIGLSDGTHALHYVNIIESSSARGGGGIWVSGSASLLCRDSVLLSTASDSGEGSGVSIVSQGPVSLQNVRFVPANVSGSVVYTARVSVFSQQNASVACPLGFEYSAAQLQGSAFVYPWSTSSRECCEFHSADWSCTACAPGTYALEGGSSWNPSITCLPVPFGAVGTGGAEVRARPGYWGTAGRTQRAIAMTRCPAGYCCSGPAPCTPYNYCQGNRNGVLCGSCLPGHSQLYSSAACVPDAECGQTLYYPAAAAIALAACMYYLYWDRGEDQGVAASMIGFYQLLPLFLVAVSEHQLWERGISELFNMRVPTGGNGASHSAASSGLCPVVGLDAVGKVVLHLLVPVLLACILSVLYIIETGILHRPRSGVRERFAVASLLLVMLAYVSLLEGTFSLHCVDIDGESRLFLSGDIRCYTGWQVLLFFVVALLYTFPFVLLWWHRSRAYGQKLPAKVRKIVEGEGKYRPGRVYWDSVVLAKRLLFVSAYAFETNVLRRLIVLTVLSIVALLCHVIARPHRDKFAMIFESSVLFILCVVGVINTRNAVFVESAQVPQGPAARMTTQLLAAQSALIVAPLVVYCVWKGAQRVRAWTGSRSSRTEEAPQRSDARATEMTEALLA